MTPKITSPSTIGRPTVERMKRASTRLSFQERRHRPLQLPERLTGSLRRASTGRMRRTELGEMRQGDRAPRLGRRRLPLLTAACRPTAARRAAARRGDASNRSRREAVRSARDGATPRLRLDGRAGPG